MTKEKYLEFEKSIHQKFFQEIYRTHEVFSFDKNPSKYFFVLFFSLFFFS